MSSWHLWVFSAQLTFPTAFSLCCLPCQYVVPLPTQILVRNLGIIFLDFLRFHDIQFITKSYQFYLLYTSHIHPLYFIPILPFSLSRVTATVFSFVSLLQVLLSSNPLSNLQPSNLSKIQIQSMVLLLYFKNLHWFPVFFNFIKDTNLWGPEWSW